MREFQERRRMRKFLHSRYAIAVIAIICLFLLRSAWGVYGKYERSRDIALKTERELVELRSREESLVRLTAALGTDQGREREIRDRFGVAKEGEKMIVIVDDAPRDAGGEAGSDRGWWQRFVGLFTRD